ncbi:MAG: hypothetical protein WBC00_06545, partial [Candidatus Omnitrophota bacterium]
MKRILGLIVLLMALVFTLSVLDCEAARGSKTAPPLSKEQVIQSAKDAVQAGGCDLTAVNVTYDDGNTFWQERLAYITKDVSKNHGILPHGILKNKEYQVVYFDFIESSPVNDAWVFVDPNT